MEVFSKINKRTGSNKCTGTKFFESSINKQGLINIQGGKTPLTVLRCGDNFEIEWWWCKSGKEGYVPRNLLGLYPRVTPHAQSH